MEGKKKTFVAQFVYGYDYRLGHEIGWEAFDHDPTARGSRSAFLMPRWAISVRGPVFWEI